MIKKLLSIFLVLVLSLTGLVIPSTDAQEAPFEIVDVDIDGNDVNLEGEGTGYIYVNRGETISVLVEVASDNLFWEDLDNRMDLENGRVDNIMVRAEILGYKYDDIEDRSDMFYIEYDGTDFANLRLTIPEDMDLKDDKYTLRIKAYNRNYEVEQSVKLRIRAERNLLDIMDVIFTPGLTLDANQPLFTTVRIENMGYEKEENIRVEVSVPQLGKSAVTYIDELVAGVDEDDDKDVESSDSTDAIYLDLRGSEKGTYDLIVKVSFDRGHEVITKNYQLVINGVQAQTQEVLVSSIETSKSVEAGQGIVYKIDIANMGSNARSFVVEVAGLDWGNYRVDPTITIVQEGSSAEMFVYVSPNSDVAGQRTFAVNVKEGNNVVKQFSFQANITEGKSEWGNILTGLQIGFVVLLVILVILGIILAATRMGKKDDEEPLGETYY